MNMEAYEEDMNLEGISENADFLISFMKLEQ
jgi:hypothetical protein